MAAVNAFLPNVNTTRDSGRTHGPQLPVDASAKRKRLRKRLQHWTVPSNAGQQIKARRPGAYPRYISTLRQSNTVLIAPYRPRLRLTRIASRQAERGKR